MKTSTDRAAQLWLLPKFEKREVDVEFAKAIAHAIDEAIHDHEVLLESAWGIIANSSGGDWSKENKDWQQAAARWRDRYHAII